MDVKQVYGIVNTVTKELLGAEAVVNEDLSNIVDVGNKVLGDGVDNYVKSLPDVIGKVLFVNRPYQIPTPSIMVDGWQFGSILQKIQSDLPEAVASDDWNLVDGKSYDPNVFHKPSAEHKFFNSKVTFEVDASFTDKQVYESFHSASEANAFYTMLTTNIENSLSLKIGGLAQRTINNFIGLTFNDNNPMRCYNLLKMYNAEFGSKLKASDALHTPEFIRYAAMQIGLITNRMKSMSKLFNIGGKMRFTPADRLSLVMLNDFAVAADVYLQADTYHNEFTALPNHETVAYWQGSGTSYDFNSISSIDVKVDTTQSGGASASAEVKKGGILAVAYDKEGLCICNNDRRVKTNYNPKAEFTNYFYKFDCEYLNDTDEQFVVFYVEDTQ